MFANVQCDSWRRRFVAAPCALSVTGSSRGRPDRKELEVKGQVPITRLRDKGQESRIVMEVRKVCALGGF